MSVTRNVCRQSSVNAQYLQKTQSTSWRYILYLSVSYLSLYLVCMYVCICLSVCLSIYHPSTYLHMYISHTQTMHTSHKVCPEVGLTAQQFRCVRCNRQLTQTPPVEVRLCDYDGLYYCPECHSNDLAVIPARVMHNWDFVARPVSVWCEVLVQLYYWRAGAIQLMYSNNTESCQL